MGERIRPGTRIRDFEPDDTESKFHIRAHFTDIPLLEIWERCRKKWPGIKMDEIGMEADHIQTSCLGHDQYDGGDYTDFITITANPEYFERMKKEKK